VLTKSGSNSYHGSIFEFFRNNALNANSFFLNRTGQQRPPLNQNQFGFALGGSIQRDKLLFFGSYQGTRQINGLASGQARTGCTVSLVTPPITSDRSPAALGKLFGGMRGASGGVTIAPDGSNINPVALALLNFKLSQWVLLDSDSENVECGAAVRKSGFFDLSASPATTMRTSFWLMPIT
jgi:hypothetical protein